MTHVPGELWSHTTRGVTRETKGDNASHSSRLALHPGCTPQGEQLQAQLEAHKEARRAALFDVDVHLQLKQGQVRAQSPVLGPAHNPCVACLLPFSPTHVHAQCMGPWPSLTHLHLTVACQGGEQAALHCMPGPWLQVETYPAGVSTQQWADDALYLPRGMVEGVNDIVRRKVRRGAHGPREVPARQAAD